MATPDFAPIAAPRRRTILASIAAAEPLHERPGHAYMAAWGEHINTVASLEVEHIESAWWAAFDDAEFMSSEELAELARCAPTPYMKGYLFGQAAMLHKLGPVFAVEQSSTNN